MIWNQTLAGKELFLEMTDVPFCLIDSLAWLIAYCFDSLIPYWEPFSSCLREALSLQFCLLFRSRICDQRRSDFEANFLSQPEVEDGVQPFEIMQRQSNHWTIAL